MSLTKRASLLGILLFVVCCLHAQKIQKKTESPELEKVRNMVSFLEYMLNTLGSSETSVRDKEVLVTESYSKIFRDNKMQIEDDLVAKRDVITNKDVPAYLKDVDFFFRDAKFEFTIEDIEEGVQSDNNLFYKVKLLRNLSGTTVEGEILNNTIPRYIEMNYNAEKQDLKIVSIYTNEFDESTALAYWWDQLSYEWQSIFKRKLNLIDSVQLSDLKRITAIRELDISGNAFVKDIGPLSQLYGLKSLNLSETKVTDLSPIRNLSELTDLNLSGTATTGITALRYSSKIINLSISNTRITDISVIEKMPDLQQLDASRAELQNFDALKGSQKLQRLNLKASNIIDLQPLDSLTELEELNLSNTNIVNLGTLGPLQNLKVLKLDSNRIADIHALKNLTSLVEVYLNHTLVSDLSALQDLPHLKRIYCDHTGVTNAIAEAFMVINPAVLVISDSEDLKTWWATLAPAWQSVFIKVGQISPNPSKEELARLTKLDSIDLSGTGITSLEPLSRLRQLRKIIANNTSVSDLSPLLALVDITYLDISHTQIGDVSVINAFKNLTEVRVSNTRLKSLNPELNLPKLKVLCADSTGIDDGIARQFINANPECLVIYKTHHLKTWWNNLSGSWKEVFRIHMGTGTGTEDLHRLAEGEFLRIESQPITDLQVLDEFIRLRELYLSVTEVTDLTPLARHSDLRSLTASESPIVNIEALATLNELATLNLSDTPLADFSVLRKMKNLKSLDCSGTLIKRLDDFEYLPRLKVLDCSNTAVRKLDPVSKRSLSMLKCYNSKVSTRRVDDFKSQNPECKVVYYDR